MGKTNSTGHIEFENMEDQKHRGVLNRELKLIHKSDEGIYISLQKEKSPLTVTSDSSSIRVIRTRCIIEFHKFRNVP